MHAHRTQNTIKSRNYIIPEWKKKSQIWFCKPFSLEFLYLITLYWNYTNLISLSWNYDNPRWFNSITCPVMLSTLEDGKIVKGLAGIPSEGPTLFVGYHMLLGIETIPLVLQFMDERNILLRGIAHPMLFKRSSGGSLPDLSRFDTIRLVGAVPVSGTNFYKLMSSKSHALLYPGGVREAVHRKVMFYWLHLTLIS